MSIVFPTIPVYMQEWFQRDMRSSHLQKVFCELWISGSQLEDFNWLLPCRLYQCILKSLALDKVQHKPHTNTFMSAQLVCGWIMASVAEMGLIWFHVSWPYTWKISARFLARFFLIWGLSLMTLSKKSSIVRYHYDYFAPNCIRACTIPNHTYETCLTFMTFDQAASDMILTIASESEQASPNGCCMLL